MTPKVPARLDRNTRHPRSPNHGDRWIQTIEESATVMLVRRYTVPSSTYRTRSKVTSLEARVHIVESISMEHILEDGKDSNVSHLRHRHQAAAAEEGQAACSG